MCNGGARDRTTDLVSGQALSISWATTAKKWKICGIQEYFITPVVYSQYVLWGLTYNIHVYIIMIPTISDQQHNCIAGFDHLHFVGLVI